MIPRKGDRILVQGMTGKQGTFWTEAMQKYGSTVVGGVNPNRAGIEHLGVPIFASAREASQAEPFDIVCMFVPPMQAKAAAVDACEAGAKLLVCLTEHIPAHDVMEMHYAAAANGTRIVGPNTAGIVTVGECFVGIMPAFNERVFSAGNIGIISRSGSLGTLTCLMLTQAGMGQSVFYGVGGDPMIGTTTAEALEFLAADENTKAVVICGEIGGRAEEDAAERVKALNIPAVAFIAGREAPRGRKMGHAGAIISGASGGYDVKRRAFEMAGVAVADVPSQIPALLKSQMSGYGVQ